MSMGSDGGKAEAKAGAVALFLEQVDFDINAVIHESS